jgi:ParB family chromosome partitioning protein
MASTQKRGLGKGFGALIPQDFDKGLLLDEQERVQKLAIDSVAPNSAQPRQHFDQDALQELAGSIRQHGILLPLVVTNVADGTYRIVAGERRWRAAKLAKLTHVPAIVRTLKELEELEIALVENVQRVDLSPLEQAVSIERLRQQFNLSHEAIAKRLGKATSTISNIARLMQLPAEAKEALATKKISEGHARALLALKDYPEQQAYLLQSIQNHSWSVRQAERYVTSVKAGVKEAAAAKARVDTETPETQALTRQFKAPVHIRRTARGGRLEITFKSDDELNRIISLLKK